MEDFNLDDVAGLDFADLNDSTPEVSASAAHKPAASGMNVLFSSGGSGGGSSKKSSRREREEAEANDMSDVHAMNKRLDAMLNDDDDDDVVFPTQSDAGAGGTSSSSRHKSASSTRDTRPAPSPDADAMGADSFFSEPAAPAAAESQARDPTPAASATGFGGAAANFMQSLFGSGPAAAESHGVGAARGPSLGRATAGLAGSTGPSTTWDGFSNFTHLPNDPDLGESIEKKYSKTALLREKKRNLRILARMRAKGVDVSKEYDMNDTLDDILEEIKMQREERHRDQWIEGAGKMAIEAAGMLELGSQRFTSDLGIDLTSLSDSIELNIGEYDDILEEVYEKYRDYKFSPELRLTWALGRSAMGVAMANAAARSLSMPLGDQVLRQNPDLRRRFEAAAQETLMQQSPAFAAMMRNDPMSTRGDGNGWNSMPMRSSPPARSAAPAGDMRDPPDVSELLRDLPGIQTRPATSAAPPTPRTGAASATAPGVQANVIDFDDAVQRAQSGGPEAAPNTSARRRPSQPKRGGMSGIFSMGL